MTNEVAPRARVKLGCLANIGNFQNVEISIEIEDSKRPSENSIDETVDRIYAYVESKVSEKLQEHIDEMSRLVKFKSKSHE
jgi:hypothetical protein